MKGKTALITGASGGIGSAVAHLLASQNWSLVLQHRDSAAATESLASRLRADGTSVLVVQADVAEPDAIARMFDRVRDNAGRLCGLVNAAGVTGGAALVEHASAAMVQQVLSTNVLGTYLCCQHALPLMKSTSGTSQGAIVNLSSRAAALGGGGEWVHYAMSKGAVDSMTLGLAQEFAAHGVRVNAIRPGVIDTDMQLTGHPDRVARALASIPLRRAGRADEVAQTIAWLLSDASSYVTGALLDVGGGR